MTTLDAPVKGWRAKIYLGSPTPINELGYATGVSIDIENNVETYHQIGSRLTIAVVEGNQEISGSIDRCWIDNKLLDLLGPVTEFVMTVIPAAASGYPVIYLYGCKPGSGSIDVPQDGFLTKSIDFTAKTIVIGTQT